MGVVWFALWAIIAITIFLAVNPTSWVVGLMAVLIASVLVVLIDLGLSKAGVYQQRRFWKKK